MAAPLIGESWQSELRGLEPGWDSYSSVPITQPAIKTVESFATVPCNDGGIQLEVHRDGFDLEIRIGPDGKIESVLIGQSAIGT